MRRLKYEEEMERDEEEGKRGETKKDGKLQGTFHGLYGNPQHQKNLKVCPFIKEI